MTWSAYGDLRAGFIPAKEMSQRAETNSESGAGRFDDGLAAAPVFEADDGVVRLVGSTCDSCGAVAFPARVVCLECGQPHTRTPLSGAGEVHATTVIANPPEGFPEEGFTYLAVDLDEGPRVLGPAVDGAQLTPGAHVQSVPGTVRDGERGFRFEQVSDA